MSRIGNTNAKKKKKKVEIGWLHEGKQIRTPRGGGTRKLSLPKESTKETILESSIPLFFPNGTSPIGNSDDFAFSLTDFSHREIDENETIEDLYASSKMSVLRIYLMSTPKTCATHDEVKDSTSSELEDPFGDAPKRIAEEPPSESHIDLNTIATTDNNEIESNISNEVLISPNILGEALYILEEGNNVLLDIANYDTGTQDDTLPNIDCIKKMSIRRGNAFSEIVNFLLNTDFDIRLDKLEITMHNEKGEDSGGVFRDAMSEFWETFYLKHTIGADQKIPTTVHIMKGEEWEAVAKVIVICLKQENYFPIQLAKSYMKKAIDDIDPSNEELLSTFLLYLPEMDRDTLKQALEDFDSVEEDDVIESLADFNVRVVPTRQNLRKLLIEVAHHELIQRPSFVTQCWYPVLGRNLRPLIENLDTLYEQSRVTNRRVLSILVLPEDMNAQEKVTTDALKQYIKTCSHDKLKMFVRFCTGSDVLVGKKIYVRVTPACSSEVLLSPVAHTCGCVLELSRSYDSFLLLREHLENILDSKVLRMDIL